MTDYRRYGSVTNGDLYLEDNSLVGLVPEFKIPDIEWKTVEIETLGQVAVLKAPSRVLEALEGSMKIQAPEPELLGEVYNPTKTHRFQIHKHVDVNGPDGFDIERSFTLVTLVQLRFFKTGWAGQSLGENEDIEAECTISRLVQRVHDSDQVLLEVDVFSNYVGNSSGAFWN